MLGKKFGKLTVVRQEGVTHRNKMWYCACECGGNTTTTTTHLRSGHTKSCGCTRGESRKRHGHAGVKGHTATYTAWSAMWNRCTNANAKQWKDWGGRGIRVCDRWLKFENFLEDMGERPSPKHSLDRKNNDGNYEPGNCRWATKAQQSSNTRRLRLIEFRGETRSLTDWSKHLGLNLQTLSHRLNTMGLSVEEAFTLPKGRWPSDVKAPFGETIKFEG